MQFWKLFAMVGRLGQILSVLSGVQAKAATTTATMYQPAADVMLGSGTGQDFLKRLSEPQKQMLATALPLALWALDSLTE